jgi:hypothetical protein
VSHARDHWWTLDWWTLDLMLSFPRV